MFIFELNNLDQLVAKKIDLMTLEVVKTWCIKNEIRERLDKFEETEGTTKVKN